MLLVIAHSDPEDKVDNHSRKQRKREDRGTEPVIESALAAHPYALRAPVECEQSIHHRHHSNESEQARADLSDLVAKVQKPDGEAA